MKTHHYKGGKTRLLSLLIIITLLSVFAIPVFALTENTAKEEVIYVNLNYDGSVNKIYVVNSFELNQNGQIIDYGDYTSFREMTACDTMKIEKEKITIDTKTSKLYYEGTLNSKTIPWSFDIQYFLDGKEYPAQSIAGKSGALEIKIKVRPNSKANNSFFEHLTLQASLSLDTFICKNIQAENATIANAGKNKQLAFMILPGRDEDISVTADVIGFKMEPLSINGISMNMSFDFEEDSMFGSKLSELKQGIANLDDGTHKLRDGTKELTKGTDKFKKGIKNLDEGTVKLKDGTAEFMDGTIDLRTGTQELDTGVNDLRIGTSKLQDGSSDIGDGMNDLLKGTRKLSDGMNEVDKGLAQLVMGAKDADKGLIKLGGGLKQLETESPALLVGAMQIFQGMLDGVSMQLEAAGIPVTLTPGNYASILNGIIDDILEQISNNPVVIMIKALKTELDASADSENFETMINEANAQLNAVGIEVTLTTEDYADVLDGLLATIADDPNLATLTMLKIQLDDYNTFYNGLVAYTTGVSQASSGLTILQKGTQQLYYGLDKLKTEGVGELLDGMDELREGTSKLRDGTIDLKEGIIELQEGVLELKDGTSKLVDGVIELEDGSIKLNDGMIELSDGIIKLLDGAIELHDGTVELHDGTVALAEGTLEFRNKTANIEKDVKDVIVDKIKEMMGGDFTPISFVSKKNTNIKSVQFVMQTPKIAIPEKEEVLEDDISKSNIWKRFLALFTF